MKLTTNTDKTKSPNISLLEQPISLLEQPISEPNKETPKKNKKIRIKYGHKMLFRILIKDYNTEKITKTTIEAQEILHKNNILPRLVIHRRFIEKTHSSFGSPQPWVISEYKTGMLVFVKGEYFDKNTSSLKAISKLNQLTESELKMVQNGSGGLYQTINK